MVQPEAWVAPYSFPICSDRLRAGPPVGLDDGLVLFLFY